MNLWISVCLETSKSSLKSTLVFHLLRTLPLLPSLTPHLVLFPVHVLRATPYNFSCRLWPTYYVPGPEITALLGDLSAEVHREQVTCPGPLSQEAAWLKFKLRSSHFTSRAHLTRQLHDTEKPEVPAIWSEAKGGGFYFLIRILPVHNFSVNCVYVFVCTCVTVHVTERKHIYKLFFRH